MRLTLAALALLSTPALAQDVAALPGGASALSEMHGNWSVNCSVGEKGKDCGFAQTAGNPQTGSALAAMELAAPAANKAEDGKPVTVSLSLSGFAAAYDRTVELAK